MSKKKKAKGNAPLRQTPVITPAISKDHMWTITNQGLIYEANEDGFLFFDAENLSGSNVYWTNLRALSVVDEGMLLTYINGAEEVLPRSYAQWEVFINNIPDRFGWFGYLLDQSPQQYQPDSEKISAEVSVDDLDLEGKKALLKQIKAKQEAWLNEDANTEEEDSPSSEPSRVAEEPAAAEVSEAVVETPPIAVTEPKPNKALDQDLLSRILTEANGETHSSNPSHSSGSDAELFNRILADATGSAYTNSSQQTTKLRESPTKDVKCPPNGKIHGISALGFTWEEIGGTSHQVDFGQYSDAYFDEAGDLVLEHRYGPLLTMPSRMEGWKDLLNRMPYRFRSLSRNKLQAILRS